MFSRSTFQRIFLFVAIGLVATAVVEASPTIVVRDDNAAPDIAEGAIEGAYAGAVIGIPNATISARQMLPTNGLDCDHPQWNPDTVYWAGDRARRGLAAYYANGWTQGDVPGGSTNAGVWSYVTECAW